MLKWKSYISVYAINYSQVPVVCCLFVWSFSSHSRIFHSYGDVTITDEGLQILTYASSYQLWYITSILYVVRRYMAEILPIRRKALYNQLINLVC